MRKMQGFHIPACSFLMLAIGLSLLSGCAFMGSEHLLKEIPASPSSAYVPRSTLPEQRPAGAEDAPLLDGRVLSLAQSIEIALKHNPETRRSWQRSNSAAAGVGQARSAYLPSADFTSEVKRSDPLSVNSLQDNGSGNTLDAGFGVRYLLLDGGARSAGLQGAEAVLLDANFQHNAVLQDVALKVEESYYQLLAAKEFERVARQTVRQTQYHVDVARARYKNGIVARSDVLKAETEKADADLQLVRAHSQTRIARGRLANSMGLKPSESFEVAQLPRDPHQQEMADINRLMAEAAKRRPELHAALARVASNRAKVKEAKARYWPKIALNADYGWQDRTFVPARYEWSFGLGLSLPLFEGFNREHTVRRAKSNLAGTAAEYDKLLRGVELEVWTAYMQLIESGKAIDAARAFVASAEENTRVTEGEYKNGTASIIEVTDAQTARTTANVRMVQVRLDWYTAMAQLERDIGRTFTRRDSH